MIVESVGSLYSSVIKKMGQLLCYVQVKQSTVVMKEKFGHFNEVLKLGCHYLPWLFGNRLEVIFHYRHTGIPGAYSLYMGHLSSCKWLCLGSQ